MLGEKVRAATKDRPGLPVLSAAKLTIERPSYHSERETIAQVYSARFGLSMERARLTVALLRGEPA